MNAGGSKELIVQIGLGQDADPREVDEAVLRLRRTLLRLDVDEVKRPSGGPAPDGARAVDGPLLGALLLTASGGTIAAAVHAAEAWLRRGSERTVRLQIGDDAIELTDVATDTQRELLDVFLARHTPPPP